MYKITFNMTSPIIYYDLPIFDSIIAYCKYREYAKSSDYHTSHGGEIIEFDLPIEKHELGFYLTSYMCFDSAIDGEDAWRKQWESVYDDIVDFGKARKRINVGSGQFKSYDIPFVTRYSKKVWFYFEGDSNAISRLIRNYLYGIGKKSIIGYGNFSDFVIETSNENQMLLYRPLPPEIIKHHSRDMQGFNLMSKTGRISPPYWLASKDKIIIPALRSIKNANNARH